MQKSEADHWKFLSDHPDVESFDLLIADCNGLLRGKRIGRRALADVQATGVRLPASVFALDILGNTVEATGLGFDTGDQDFVCRPLIETLKPVPWAQRREAQLLLDMFDPDGAPFDVNPRTLLTRMTDKLREADLRPTVAIELEFYLLDRKLSAKGDPQLAVNPLLGTRDSGTQVYGMDDIDAFHEFIDLVNDCAEKQGVPATSAVAEYAPGQFEINLLHRDDPAQACDEAILLKRLIRACARAKGYCASFMAKPFAELSGSGLHAHVSLYDASRRNVFASHPEILRHAIGGLQQTLSEAMLVFAPHANSYRRFRPDSFVPLSGTWGFNNRTVAMRIPTADPESMRIEHRVAGADANPYLVTAAILAAIDFGIERRLVPDDPIDGNAYLHAAQTFPTDWHQAIESFANSNWVSHAFGTRFHHVYREVKRAEFNAFRKHITPLEVQWYLRTV
jgi:glutamine synthetase